MQHLHSAFNVQVILSSIRQSTDEDGEIAAPEVEEVTLGNHQLHVRCMIVLYLFMRVSVCFETTFLKKQMVLFC